MFLFKKSKKRVNSLSEFHQAMHNVEIFLMGMEDTEDKLLILNSVLKMIKTDIQAEYLSDIIYKEESRDLTPFFLPVVRVSNENGDEVLFESKGEVLIDLKSDAVFLMPWRNSSFTSTLLNIKKNGFRYHETNHLAYYFQHLDFTYLYNGNHSVMAGIVHGDGKIKAKMWDTTLLYPHVYCTGEGMYSVHTGEKIYSIQDFRLGLLFMLSKQKHALEQEI